jgi:hypothetical protein
MLRIKGMVQVGGDTFRIERINRFAYTAIRIRDEKRVGTFQTDPLAIVQSSVEPTLMEEIARAAMRGGKTSWARRFRLF